MSTYTQIASTTLTSSTTSVTLSNLGSYTDLIIIASVQGSRQPWGGDLLCRFNGDSGANYPHGLLRGSSAGTATAQYTGESQINLGGEMGASGSNFGVYYIFLPNYRNTSIHKNVIVQSGIAGTDYNAGNNMTVGIWKNTAAITSINLTNSNGAYNLLAGSTFSVYGITAA
jgi:hypothetical protein